MKIKIFILLIIASSFFYSCFSSSGLEKKEFSPKNPTSYIFNIEEDKIEEIILKIFDIEYQYDNPLPFTSRYKDMVVNS